MSILPRRKIYDILTYLALLVSAAALVMFPKQAVSAASEGVTLCFNVIIPSLFPFFVLSTLTVELGVAGKLGRLIEPLMRRLFNVNGACSAAFILGFIGGYPVGAKTAVALYERGECSKQEAERLLSFCNNSGPAFILGVVGASVFSDSRVGILLYLVHTTASVITGIIFRSWHQSQAKSYRHSTVRRTSQGAGFTSVFTSSVKSSFQSMLNICGFVIFFMVFIRMLFLAGIIPFFSKLLAFLLSPVGIDESAAEKLLTGVIELSSGVWSLKGAAESLSASAAMAAFMLGWAGLSVHCQTLSFLCDSGLSARSYILGKLIQGVLSAALVYLLFHFIPFDSAAASYLAGQVSGMADVGFTRALAVSLGCSVATASILTILAALSAKRCGKKHNDDI